MASKTSLCSESFVLCADLFFRTVILGPNHCICINKCDKASNQHTHTHTPLPFCGAPLFCIFVDLSLSLISSPHLLAAISSSSSPFSLLVPSPPCHDIRCVGAAIRPDGEYIKKSDCNWSHRSAKLIFWFWACPFFSAFPLFSLPKHKTRTNQR